MHNASVPISIIGQQHGTNHRKQWSDTSDLSKCNCTFQSSTTVPKPRKINIKTQPITTECPKSEEHAAPDPIATQRNTI